MVSEFGENVMKFVEKMGEFPEVKDNIHSKSKYPSYLNSPLSGNVRLWRVLFTVVREVLK